MRDLHSIVRIGEVAVIGVLSVFAFVTWRELNALRNAPVALPSYQFEATSESDDMRMIVTRGTWVSENGPPEPLLTTTIECRKPRMECIESAASVAFVSGRGLLESEHTMFAVEKWTDAEVVTKSTPGKCSSRKLVFDLKEKRAKAVVSASEARGLCKDVPARTMELVAGFKVPKP